MSIPEQVAEVIREGILTGRWKDAMPGRDKLVSELGVSGNSMEAAIR